MQNITDFRQLEAAENLDIPSEHHFDPIEDRVANFFLSVKEQVSKIEILATKIILSQTINVVMISDGRLETYGREYGNPISVLYYSSGNLWGNCDC